MLRLIRDTERVCLGAHFDPTSPFQEADGKNFRCCFVIAIKDSAL